MIAVIGDIHGCYDTLLQLYDKVKSKYPKIEIYSVGDLVDRGNYSYEVMEFFISNKIKFSPGNHDYMFYAYVYHPNSMMARAWLLNGNEATLRSYLDHTETIKDHLEYIKSMPLYHNLDDCFISHAGISDRFDINITNLSNEELNLFDDFIKSQSDTDEGLLWTRDKLHNIGKLQVVGHTRQRKVNLDKRSNAAYIDTGAYSGNKLSAVIIEKNEIVDILDVDTSFIDIN